MGDHIGPRTFYSIVIFYDLFYLECSVFSPILEVTLKFLKYDTKDLGVDHP